MAIPHLRIVVLFSLMAVLGYAGFSVYVMNWSGDAALRGDVLGTWKSFAVLAFGFWMGSSSGGKAKDGLPVPTDAKTAAGQVVDAAAARSEEIAQG